MRQSHGLFRPSGAFFRLQFSAVYTINMFGFDFRHGQDLSPTLRPGLTLNVSGLDAAPASRNTAALANWFRAAHTNQVKLAPYRFHCQIGSRYALESRMYAFSFLPDN